MIHNPITQLEQLTLTSASKSFLRETAKWTKFLAIIGFVLTSLLLVFAVFLSTTYNSVAKTQLGIPDEMGVIMIIPFLILAIVYFFPMYYLLQFSNEIKRAFSTKDDAILASAFEALKSHYKYIGVFTIITLSLYALFFVASIMLGGFV